MAIVLSTRIAGGTLFSDSSPVVEIPAVLSVNADNTVTVGSTGNTLSVENIAVTSVTIDGMAVSNLSGSGDSYTFDLGGFINDQFYPRVGVNVALVASDGTNVPELNVVVNPPVGMSVVTLETVSTGEGSILNSFQIPAQIGDQIFWTTSNGTVTSDGNWYGDYEGTQTLWVRSVDDGIIESYSVITQDIQVAH